MKLYMAAFLAVSFLDIFNEGIVRGSFGNQMSLRNSCIDLHTREINIQRISDYEQQEIPFKAVIFITRTGARICVQHNLSWVQKHIKHLKRKSSKTSKPSKKLKSTSRPRARPTSRSTATSS